MWFQTAVVVWLLVEWVQLAPSFSASETLYLLIYFCTSNLTVEKYSGFSGFHGPK